MKGIALAMETMVYIILAVLVLAILLYFLTTNAAPLQNQAQLEEKRAKYCSMYVQHNSDCNNPGGVTQLGTDAGKTVVKDDLLKTCDKIGISSCSVSASDRDQAKCIQTCCYVCPVQPSGLII